MCGMERVAGGNHHYIPPRDNRESRTEVIHDDDDFGHTNISGFHRKGSNHFLLRDYL